MSHEASCPRCAAEQGRSTPNALHRESCHTESCRIGPSARVRRPDVQKWAAWCMIQAKLAPHADQHPPVCRDSGPLAIHQHLALLPQMPGRDKGELMSTIRGPVQLLASYRNNRWAPTRDWGSRASGAMRLIASPIRSRMGVAKRGRVFLSVGLSTHSTKKLHVRSHF